jgi:hypothetical protein
MPGFHPRFSRLACASLLLGALLSSAAPAAGKGKPGVKKDARLALITPNGRPTIKIDKVELPPDVAGAKGYAKYLKKRLLRESRRAKWGAGRNNVIQYRFKISELSISDDGDVLRVRCSAVGKLPRGQAAKSQLTFSGDPRKRRKVIEHVLDIVARGVVTRLAELERIRRGDLSRSGVRAPRVVD